MGKNKVANETVRIKQFITKWNVPRYRQWYTLLGACVKHLCLSVGPRSVEREAGNFAPRFEFWKWHSNFKSEISATDNKVLNRCFLKVGFFQCRICGFGFFYTIFAVRPAFMWADPRIRRLVKLNYSVACRPRNYSVFK